MALNMSQRPKGVILSTTPESATITNSSGDALVTDSSHGLLSGDVIFITSDASYYNGFWEVVYIDGNTFKLRQFTYDTSLSYVVDASIIYYKSTTSHYFSSVHLPIIYRLQSTLWPTNQADTVRTVSSFSNDNGYTRLNLSGDIKASGSAQVLEFVKLTVNGVEGVYQILNWFSDTSITIDLGYDGGITFGNCQYYYSNYNAKIRIYAGITGTGSVIKPFELITEIEAVPDSDSIITINVNEYLKNKISVLKNDPAQATIPRDIDSFCEFYIEYAESYDQSIDGYTLGTYTSSYTTDSVTGYAVNSKLPFKNRYSGFMSEYLGASRKFLTMFTEPVLFVGNYYDIAFLNDANGVELRRERYLNSSLIGTSYDNIPNYEEGVYRKQVSQELTEDRVDVSLVNRSALPALTDWTNQGTGQNWTLGANPSISTSTAGLTKYLSGAFNSVAGVSYSIPYDIDLAGATNLQDLYIHILDSSLNSLGSYQVASSVSPDGNYSGNATITPTGSGAYVAVRAFILDALTTVDIDVNSITFSGVTVLSEIKTIEVNSDCSNQDIYLTWKNPLGGHDYWKFTAEKEYGVDILEVKETTKNINTNWPNSYGEFADTIKQDISRTANDTILVRSQNLTLGQVQAMKYIKTSPLVQIMTSKTDRRTVIVDRSSFTTYNETDKLYGIQFTISYTDDIPSQGL